MRYPLSLRPLLALALVTVAPVVALAEAAPDPRASLTFGTEIELGGLNGYDDDECHQCYLERYTRLDATQTFGRKLEDRPWFAPLSGEYADLVGKGWTDTCDKSVLYKPAGEPTRFGEEIVSPILTYTDRQQVGRVLAAVRQGGGGSVCMSGMHVHVGVAHLPVDALLHLVRLSLAHEPEIFFTFKVHGQRTEKWAQPTPPLTVSEILTSRPADHAALLMSYVKTDAIHGLALDFGPLLRLGTVEFRLFNSTTDKDIADLAVDFALAWVALAAQAGPFTEAHWDELSTRMWRRGAGPGEPSLLSRIAALDASLAERMRDFALRKSAELGEAFNPTCRVPEADLEAPTLGPK